MKQKEKELFKKLCSFNSDRVDKELLKYATPAVLGQLFFNRMQGIAYYNLKTHNLLGMLNREFRNAIRSAYEQNVQKNKSYFKCVRMVSEILSQSDVEAAMLKGAVLCACYPEGCRTANDIDLLVLPHDVTSVGKLLISNGFKQGSVTGGEFIPASRADIIQSKMLRGETVPFIKEVDLPFMKYLEVDINFSLDYKNGENDILSAFLGNRRTVLQQGISLPTLGREDFFIHLCVHLYKEATTLPWIEMRRDMTLYKYCDIYMLLDKMTDAETERMFARAEELRLDKICAYAILETADLFDMNFQTAIRTSEWILSGHPAFRLQVTDPAGRRLLTYKTASAADRFFVEDRAAELKEDKTNEKT